VLQLLSVPRLCTYLQGFLLDSSEVVNFQDGDVSNVHSKQRAVIGFLLAENESITNIHRRLTNVYGDMAVDKSTISLWAEQLASSEQRRQCVWSPALKPPINSCDACNNATS
jgi:hypothetical protein